MRYLLKTPTNNGSSGTVDDDRPEKTWITLGLLFGCVFIVILIVLIIKLIIRCRSKK